MIKRRHKATGTKQEQLKSAVNGARKFSLGVHTQEVTDSSSVVSTRKRLISQEIGHFYYFFGAKLYGSKFGSAQDPDRDPYADKTQWSGLHGRLPPNIIREECCAVLEVWGAPLDLAPLREFFRRQTEKTWRKADQAYRGVGEGVLFVLPSSCSITPPDGEGAPSVKW